MLMKIWTPVHGRPIGIYWVFSSEVGKNLKKKIGAVIFFRTRPHMVLRYPLLSTENIFRLSNHGKTLPPQP